MFYSPQTNRRKRWYRLLTISQKKLLVLAAMLGVGILVILGGLIFYTTRAMDYDMARVVNGNGQNMLYDSANQPIASLDGEEVAPPLQWQELPQNLINAFVAREDEDFFNHNGVVLSAVARSIVRNISSMRYEQGASTITMQLTRNVFELTSDKSLDRKMLEVMLAQRIERNYNKQTILLQYLDRIFFGQGCYGVRAAAQRYFGKSVSDLDLGECAMLAGVVRGPSIFNPEHNMKAAVKVRNETLQRMLECEMITHEECEAAKNAPIVLKRGESENTDSTYPSMWARSELGTQLQEETGKSSGIAVVSNLNLPLQQFLEDAVEDTLTAIEVPARYPESWKTLTETPEEAEEAQKAFAKLKRPKTLKVRGNTNDLTGLLQGCVLVVDARNTRRGNVLAVCGGRCAADGRDRWQEPLYPGRAAAPLVFCGACMPGGDNAHIVARSAEVTGQSLGYDMVYSFFESLQLKNTPLPDREHENDLYNGLYPMKKIDLAHLLFCLQNQGRGYKLSLINTIWSTGNRTVLYRYEPEKAPEYIRRESATTVAQLPPFVVTDGQPVCLNETLPNGMGQFAMLCRKKGICVFVWLGLDDNNDPNATARELRALLPKAAMNLARTVYNKAREEVKKQSDAEAAAK